MPEYLAPGVYVEEVSFRSKTIEGVSTTTTGFVGPTRYGPVEAEPEVLTSLLDFERTYGDRRRLDFADATSYVDPDADEPSDNVRSAGDSDNYLWHAVRAFFENGGARLYVKRVFRPVPAPDPDGRKPGDEGYEDTFDPAFDGRAGVDLGGVTVKARFPGVAGARRVRLTLQVGQNVLVSRGGEPSVSTLLDRDVVLVRNVAFSPPLSPPSPVGSPPAVASSLCLAERYTTAAGTEAWRLRDTAGTALDLADLLPDPDPALSDQIRPVTISVTDIPPDDDAVQVVWAGLPLDPRHQRGGVPDSVFARFGTAPANRSDALGLPITIECAADADGLDVLRALFDYDQDHHPGGSPVDGRFLESLLVDDLDSTDAERSLDLLLTGGDDGARPTASEYEGTVDPDTNAKTGLKAFEDIEDISIVAAPGSTFGGEGPYRAQAGTIMRLLIGHAERMRYRIAVLDSADNQSVNQVRALRAGLDSKYAALYYPWVVVLDPLTQREIPLPPSGFACGIYARNDRTRAVYKAPANEIVDLALRFETTLSKGQQDVLNPEGVNCFRYFPGRGYRLWGARTISSDPEWKYVNLRRYFAYLEHSIDRGTQWAVFEPNGEALWANVRRTIEDFLLNEFQMGALLGEKPERAYFVKCDRSTMTQNDLDNGRLVCQIGVAALRPAEFVIFRIGQWTSDRRS
jgi:phage tail sheath protein FI